MTDDKYHTIEDVAEMLHVVYLTVYRWIQSGRLPAYRVGKRYLIKDNDLKQLIKAYDRKPHVRKAQ